MKRVIRTGLFILVLVSLLAAIGVQSTGSTKIIFAGALADYECDATEWHFVITQISSESLAPQHIVVEFADLSNVQVPLGAFTGKTAHYTYTSNLGSPVVSATAEIYLEWSGQFNVSHGPCEFPPKPTPEITPHDVTSTPTPTDPPPTATPTDPAPTATPIDPTPTETETPDPTETPDATPTAPPFTATPPPPPPTGPTVAEVLKTEFMVDSYTLSVPSVDIEAPVAIGGYDGDWIMSAFYYDGTYWPEFDLIGLHSPAYDELYDVELGDLVYFNDRPYMVYETILVGLDATWALSQADLTLITCYGPNWNQRFVAYAYDVSLFLDTLLQ